LSTYFDFFLFFCPNPGGYDEKMSRPPQGSHLSRSLPEMSGIGWIADGFSIIRFSMAVCIFFGDGISFGNGYPPEPRTARICEIVRGRIGLMDTTTRNRGSLPLRWIHFPALPARHEPRDMHGEEVASGLAFPRREITGPSDTEFKTWRNRDAFTLDIPEVSWKKQVTECCTIPWERDAAKQE
jgi:hypothetical protein